jgi:hypothetical protein
MKDNFDIVKHVRENNHEFWGKTFKYDDKGGNTYDNDYAEKYFIKEADPEWDRVDYDKADIMIRGEFWAEGGARLYDIISKMVDAGQRDQVIKSKTLKAARAIEKKVKDPKADGNLQGGIDALLDMYINNAKQRHHK